MHNLVLNGPTIATPFTRHSMLVEHSVSKHARTMNVAYRPPSKGHITDLVIDSISLKVFGEGNWKVRKHSAEKRRFWRKLHLAVDPASWRHKCRWIMAITRVLLTFS